MAPGGVWENEDSRDVFIDILDGLSEDLGEADARSVIKTLYDAAQEEMTV
jgi:hypothetical protein